MLFISLADERYKILTSEDISHVFELRQGQTSFFTMVSMVSSLVVALILYVFCYLLTKRISILNRALNQISGGNYKISIPEMGSDEIGNLSEVVSKMARSVDENIKEINKISESRQDFINNITHEIGTPLTSIIGFSSLIKNKKVTEENIIAEYAGKIYDEGMYINQISDKLMKIIMLDNRSMKFESINISDVLEQIILDAKSAFGSIKIESQISKGVYGEADKELMKSLIMNLIKNSAHAYEDGVRNC